MGMYTMVGEKIDIWLGLDRAIDTGDVEGLRGTDLSDREGGGDVGTAFQR